MTLDRIILLFLISISLLPSRLNAQKSELQNVIKSDLIKIDPISKNWSLCDDVQVGLSKSNNAKIIKGNQALIGLVGDPLKINILEDTVNIEFQFLLGNTSAFTINLPGRNAISISNSNGISITPEQDGFIVPLKNALSVPGLWQSLKLNYTINSDNKIILRTFKINNVDIVQNLPLQNLNKDNPSISLKVISEFLAIREINTSPISTAAKDNNSDKISMPLIVERSYPELLRSFVKLEHEEKKRVKCLTVGSNTGRHYTVDIDNGILIMAWKGDFADVSGIWHGRATDQTLEPTGALIDITPKGSNFYVNESLENSESINFIKYNLDKDGYPIFNYSILDRNLQDHILSTNNGLIRTIKLNSDKKNPLIVKLAEGNKIEQIEKNLFRINGNHFIRIIKSSAPAKQISVHNNELIASLAEELIFEILW